MCARRARVTTAAVHAERDLIFSENVFSEEVRVVPSAIREVNPSTIRAEKPENTRGFGARF